MAPQASIPEVRLHSLLLADHVYCDSPSGKYVIAGTFHQLSVAEFPTTFASTTAIFVSLSNVTEGLTVDLKFVDCETDTVLRQSKPLRVPPTSTGATAEFAVEVPPLPLPHSGLYRFRISTEGTVLGSTTVMVRSLTDDVSADSDQYIRDFDDGMSDL